MTESMLTALMKLFAILASINKDVPVILSRNFVYSYLKTQFSQKIVDHSLLVFDQEINKLTMLVGMKESKRTSSLSVKVLSICNEINQGLHIRGKYLIAVSLIQFSKYFEDFPDTDNEFRQTISDMVKTISEYMMINEDEYNNCRIFITEKFYNVPQKDRLLVLSNISSSQFTKINYINKENLKGQFFFLKIQQSDIILFYYTGIERFELSGKSIFPGHIYIFPKGSALKSENISPIYFSDVESGFLRTKEFEKISLLADNIEFRFVKSDNGIQKFSLPAQSGDLIGVMGGSGTGKSTLLKVLNGSYNLNKGKILINGHNLKTSNKELLGLIGYVPQDDLLIEELTVYQNLYYNAKLCLGDQDDAAIHNAVVRYLNNLDLFYIKDLLVGSPLNKFISGGQRKRLNIALELIKEPLILLADEPTTGLSSTDSENVMQLLKDLSLKGKIVIINIHQPSSEIFKMLDKILIMDKGGYPVYLGNPLDSFKYLKDIASRIDAAEIECPYCGNVQPDEILKVIEAKQVNELGEYTSERIISPEKWYEMFMQNLQSNDKTEFEVSEIPESKFKTPSRIKQFKTYFLRNFYAKLSDRQYILIALFIAPILSLIVSGFTKYVSSTSDGMVYRFIDNVNIPAYIFMSVIVSLFIGLIISAEEIIKDNKILEREKFLNLSRLSYINSKIVFLFGLSALQMLIFVLLGNYILEIRNLNLNYWLVLFSTSCFAIMLGLNISATLKSVIAIYITIPFILVPLILLSGVIVKYDKLHYSIASSKYVPFIGDMMASRWAYEALMVNQFENNAYQKNFNEVDKKSANISYSLNFLIPELYNKIADYERLSDKNQESGELKKTVAIIRNTLLDVKDEPGIQLPACISDKSSKELNINELNSFLGRWKAKLIKKSNALTIEKDRVIEKLKKEGMSNEDLIALKEKNYNRALAETVLNSNEMIKITVSDNRLIRKDTPVFQFPLSRAGRAQFYSDTKRLGRLEISTLWFNIMVLWFMSFMLYLLLAFDGLRKISNALSKRKLRKSQ